MGKTLLGQLEFLAFRLQYWYMKRKITNEKVGRHSAFFHPLPTGKIVLEEYNRRLKHLRGGVAPAAHLGGVVLVTGCFDILHSEHIKFLTAAKAVGDILLVGVESDQRVSQLKGLNRPVNSLKTRLKNLRQLGIADKVFSLPEKFSSPKDHLALINQIKPDILAVSSSTPHLATKRRIMKQFAGQVKIVLTHNPQISTSRMLK